MPQQLAAPPQNSAIGTVVEMQEHLEVVVKFLMRFSELKRARRKIELILILSCFVGNNHTDLISNNNGNSRKFLRLIILNSYRS